jgi:aspartyl-tRNA(Asn)/glutamyl-tRNA(Gln) amidotransferase subunit B
MSDILSSFPELPLERRARFILEYNLPEYDAEILTSERSLSDYFEKSVQAYQGDPKRVSNWLMNDVLRMIKDQELDPEEMNLSPKFLAEIIHLVDSGKVNTSTGKALLEKVQKSGISPDQIMEREGLGKVDDVSSIRSVVMDIIRNNPKEVVSYQSGKESLIGWFVGQVMKSLQGKADPAVTRAILEENLKK